MSRNLEKTDECVPEALWAHSDVVAEERHDEAERGEALVPHHQLKDESCNGVENLNGDISKKIHDDAVRKKRTNLPGELEKALNRRAACVRPHKEIQTDTGADGDGYKPSLQTQEPNFAKLRKDGGQKSHKPNTQQLDTNSKHMWHLNTGGSPTEHVRTHSVDCMLEQHCESIKKRFQANESDWETHSNIHQFRMNESIGCNYSSNLCRKSNCSKRDEEKMQVVVAADSKLNITQTVTKGEITATPRERRNAAKSKDKVIREPWRC